MSQNVRIGTYLAKAQFNLRSTATTLTRHFANRRGGRGPTVHSYPSVPIPGAPAALSWYVNVGKHKSSLGIKILGGTPEESDYYFERLKEREHSIREAFGEEIAWEKGPGRTRWVRREQRETGGFEDDPGLQKRAAGAIAEVLGRFVVATEDLAGGIPVFSDRPADGDEIDDDG